MDDFKKCFYDLTFKVAFMEKKAQGFQDFFSDLMELRHPGVFVRSRTWGNIGDRASDGQLPSEKAIFACYGPHGMTAKNCITKIEDDFDGAVAYWKDMGKWVFVHNDMQGLGPTVTKRINELRATNPKVQIEIWGFQRLRQEALGLGEDALFSLLGPAPSRGTMMDLGLADLAPVLDDISGLDRPSGDLLPVPSNKLEYNRLSEEAMLLISTGLQRSPLVRKYFGRRITLQDKLAARFQDEYEQLSRRELSPDEILSALQRFAGGGTVGTPKRQAAILACIAFFFEECDIFERPRGEA